ncbi:MAG: ABC transporter permease subunit [Clostridiales bacterium]|nr:ABC transporter permease subunit [Clostridiales bacterium]
MKRPSPTLLARKTSTDRLIGLYRYMRKDYMLYLMILPGIAYILIFKYWPMYGISIAFRDFSIFKGYADAPWVGLRNFVNLFGKAGFIRALKNNIIISLLKLIMGFPTPIILSLMINELSNLKYKKLIQTSVILPNFVSWVVINGLLYAIFSPSSGAIQGLLAAFGYDGKFPNLLTDKSNFRMVIVLSHIWKGAGMGTIVYLAAIAGIDREQYEAAAIDGAGRLSQMWHITLASLRSTIVILLIFRVGEMMYAGFDQIFAISNPLVISVADIIDTYVYTIGLEQRNFMLATAAGLFQSFIGLMLVLITNAIANRIEPDSSLMNFAKRK